VAGLVKRPVTGLLWLAVRIWIIIDRNQHGHRGLKLLRRTEYELINKESGAMPVHRHGSTDTNSLYKERANPGSVQQTFIRHAPHGV
jgi:hypothetical protein